jgi:polar amino acid transport system substrate-binding protein
VFINLILNACQSLKGRDRAISVSSLPGAQGSTVQVTVRDEGVGIPAEILPRVRDAFFTTRGASGGTGLGLYVSQAIVAAHGGTLELSSGQGDGTTAVVILPAEAAG